MEISPEWAGIAVGVAGPLVAWLIHRDRRADRLREVQPLMRAEWARGTHGYSATVTIINRLNEDLHVTQAEAPRPFAKVRSEYDPATSNVVRKDEGITASPMQLDWTIPPLKQDSRQFVVSDFSGGQWIRLTVRSSLGTLRRTRRKLVAP